MNDYLAEVFGERGFFAAHYPGYERRPGQVALARTIDQAMRTGRHALCEAPCGTGKGIAYLVPAIWHAHHRKKRVVVATANIALQEQLTQKDLPALARVLPWPFSFALMKGRNNYLCQDRLVPLRVRAGRSSAAEGGAQVLDQVLAWAEETTTGDISELPFVPPPEVWSRVSVSADECKGEGCAFRDTCFADRARAAAQDVDVVVTNDHLLFAHLSVRSLTGKDLVLPAFDLLVLDEAHEIADIARTFFGFTLSEHTFARLATAAARLGDAPLGERLRADAREVFGALTTFARSPAYDKRLRKAGAAPSAAITETLRKLIAHATSRASDGDASADERAAARSVVRRAKTADRRLSEGLELADPKKVYWLEFDARGNARLAAKPLDMHDVLAAELFGQCPSVCLVSATLTTSGSFAFIRRELGVPDDALQVIAESPFDFQAQALLVVPEGLPDPRAPTFIDAATDVFRSVLEACDGRTLGLFTSYRNLNAVHERIADGGYRVLRQGDLPRAELTRLFKEDVCSVLLGTESFWTGIDVPGEALTGLVVDKLPFPSPDDPIIDAICARDPNAFENHLLPRAILLLRQGVGRLIRSQTDIGVVVLLDRRIAEKRYGRRFLASLPPMLTTRRLEHIGRFLREARGTQEADGAIA